MSKKRKHRKPKPHTLVLEKGKYYIAHDRSKKGHPCRIEFIDDENGFYLSVTTGSMTEEEYKNKPFRKDYIELRHPTSEFVYKSFVNKRPFIGTRDDYGDKELLQMEIHYDDLDKISEILLKKPREGYWYKITKKPSD